MSQERDYFDFDGTSGEECERFIRYVRRKTVAEGKQGDDKWIMNIASSCLGGDALRWESTLGPDITSNWSKFQRALLERYPRNTGFPSPAAIPTPAAAAPLPSIQRTISSPAAPPPSQTLTGRIRIITNHPSIGGYVSSQYDRDGIFVSGGTRNSALRVRFTQSFEIQGLEILNSPDNLQWLGAMQRYYGSTMYAALCTTSGPGYGKVTASYRNGNGDSKSVIWILLPDKTIQPIWDVGGLNPVVIAALSDKDIFLTWDALQFRTTYSTYPVVPARLLFEED